MPIIFYSSRIYSTIRKKTLAFGEKKRKKKKEKKTNAPGGD